MDKIRLWLCGLPYFKDRCPDSIRVESLQEFSNICKSVSLFGEREYHYTGLDINVDLFNRIKETNVVIHFVGTDIDKRSVLYKHCNKHKTITTQPLLNSSLLKKKFPQLSSQSINTILTRTQEENKVFEVFTMLESFDEVTDDKVNWMFSGDFIDKVFECLDFLMVGNHAKFFELYYELMAMGESRFKFMVLLQARLKNLLQLKPYINAPVNEIQTKTGLNYYQVKNNLMAANKHPISKLRDWYLWCGRIERDIKYGMAREDLDLEALILDILRR